MVVAACIYNIGIGSKGGRPSLAYGVLFILDSCNQGTYLIFQPLLSTGAVMNTLAIVIYISTTAFGSFNVWKGKAAMTEL